MSSAVPIAALLLAFPFMLASQTRPSDAAQAVFAALKQHDWRQLATLIDPASLEEFREDQLRTFVAWARQKDEIAAANRVHGNWSLDIHNDLPPAEIAATKDMRVPTLAGSPTIGTLAAESPANFFSRICRAAYESSHTWGYLGDFRTLKRDVIGELADGDSLAYVLYRREARHIEDNTAWIDLPGNLKIAPMRARDGHWLMVLDDDIGWGPDLGELLPTREEWPGERAPKLATRTRTTPLQRLPPGAGPPRRSAGDAVRDAFAAFARGDWKAFATLVHPDRLAEFKREEIASLIAWENSRDARERAKREGMGVFMMSFSDTLTDSDIAQAASVKTPVFGGSTTIGDLAQLAPAAFFERWCAVVFGAESIFASRREEARRIIGEVQETDGLTQVVYQASRWKSVQRMPVVRTLDDWGIYLNEDVVWHGALDMLLDKP